MAGRLPAAAGAGVVTHLLCDLVPHRDYDITVEAPLALAMLIFLGARYGKRSPQFWGAIGAVLVASAFLSSLQNSLGAG